MDDDWGRISKYVPHLKRFTPTPMGLNPYIFIFTAIAVKVTLNICYMPFLFTEGKILWLINIIIKLFNMTHIF